MSVRPKIQKNLEDRGGVITGTNKEFRTIRLRIPGGIISPDQLVHIGKTAKKIGSGTVHLTIRQTIEISHVPIDKIPTLIRDLEKKEIFLGAEYQEVVNITACPGTDRCRYSIIDTRNILLQLDNKHHGRDMPIKVRIAISSCPNGCTSERASEIGITGLRTPIRNEGLCTGCGTCAHTCKENAIIMINGRLHLDTSLCVNCGMCIDSCPFHIIKGHPPMFMITVGGRRGRHMVQGRELIVVDSEEKAIAVVDTVIDWIYRYAYSGKTLTDQMDAMKFSVFQKRIQRDFPVSRTE
ncbi:nitrite reductase [Methanocalculus taiwanensis]|uniref:Nitrite reductase n=1 Tax=Methanocalculus taiwanensis TaxID=106207 RepID=A0ABD4TKQ4_9EURY|nr:4Fe-4S binding protein [Methanocalculus taiwanensis]MCQ1539479.1 nitrite reductase [Methanocalculus taiwanensis]